LCCIFQGTIGVKTPPVDSSNSGAVASRIVVVMRSSSFPRFEQALAAADRTVNDFDYYI
jgi:hypothetical protein